jgi:hypothetical protein
MTRVGDFWQYCDNWGGGSIGGMLCDQSDRLVQLSGQQDFVQGKVPAEPLLPPPRRAKCLEYLSLTVASSFEEADSSRLRWKISARFPCTPLSRIRLARVNFPRRHTAE